MQLPPINRVSDARRLRLARRAAHVACAWAFVFAAAHLYWAFGGACFLNADQVGEARTLLARRPSYYWTSWLSLGAAFALVGLFPLALARSRTSPLPRWLERSVVWGVGAVLLLLTSALIASGTPPWAPLLFISCAAGLVWIRFHHGTVPLWALHSITFILGLGMTLYGVFGLVRLSLWGAWWFLGGVMFVTAAGYNTNWSAVRSHGTPPAKPVPSTERVCVGALLLNSRSGPTQILLGRRAPDRTFYPDVWDVPGGHIEPGETPERTLVRELMEELGVTPTAWRPPERFREPVSACDETLVLYLYVVTAWAGTPRNCAPAEHAEIAWFTTEDACTLPLAHSRYAAFFQRLAGRER